MIPATLENDLYDYEVYDAWQFVKNADQSIATAKYCQNVIASILQQSEEEHTKWLNTIFEELPESVKLKTE